MNHDGINTHISGEEGGREGGGESTQEQAVMHEQALQENKRQAM